MVLNQSPSFKNVAAICATFLWAYTASGQSESPSRSELKNASQQLRASYQKLVDGQQSPSMAIGAVDEEDLPAPQRESLALASNASFVTPGALSSRDQVLRATLVVTRAHNIIGEDRVFLRSYNGGLVGPTLRAKPGDTLRITVRNDLEPEPTFTGDMNTLHGFNRTNLHTHGLHVSPAGVGDNVLLTIAPGATQEYEIQVPGDHDPGTFWYHAHVHGATAAQVSSGMAGMLIIEGGLDDLPKIQQARERIFMLQQIPYYTQGLDVGVVEEQYSNEIFGPGRWDALGRFTTVNGVQVPVLAMAPGSVERWRIVHAGVREEVLLKIVPPGSSDGSTFVPLHEIARDGLALGRIDTQSSIELWPGYRSDVLIKAPEEAGEYLVIDERLEGDETLDGNASSRKYIAKIVVSGEPQAMDLPSASELEDFRKPTLLDVPDVEVGEQSAHYAIVAGPRFTIDGQEFSHSNPRELTLGTVDQWTLTANQAHPFHIHVNPFEVYSIRNNTTGDELVDEPFWKDTLVVKSGFTVKMRTKYERFSGVFVQHCHILDHEDQGMMQLVEVVDPHDGPLFARSNWHGELSESSDESDRFLPTPYDARHWELPDATGRLRNLSEFHQRAIVLILFQGHGCLHCSEQISLFSESADRFADRGIQCIGVTTDTVDDLALALESVECTFPLVCDPQLKTFRDYACIASDKPLHGTYVIDANRRIGWQSVSTEPFMSVDTLLQVVDRLGSASDR